MPNLAVRVTDRGRVSFYAVKRRAGSSSPTWALLGAYPQMKLGEAREAIGALMAGNDPAAIAEAKRLKDAEAAEAAERGTLGAVAKEFLRLYVPRLKSAGLYESRLRSKIMPALGVRPIAEIGRREIVALLDDFIFNTQDSVRGWDRAPNLARARKK